MTGAAATKWAIKLFKSPEPAAILAEGFSEIAKDKTAVKKMNEILADPQNPAIKQSAEEIMAKAGEVVAKEAKKQTGDIGSEVRQATGTNVEQLAKGGIESLPEIIPPAKIVPTPVKTPVKGGKTTTKKLALPDEPLKATAEPSSLRLKGREKAAQREFGLGAADLNEKQLKKLGEIAPVAKQKHVIFSKPTAAAKTPAPKQPAEAPKDE